jgi:hypothetical protein
MARWALLEVNSSREVNSGQMFARRLKFGVWCKAALDARL